MWRSARCIPAENWHWCRNTHPFVTTGAVPQESDYFHWKRQPARNRTHPTRKKEKELRPVQGHPVLACASKIFLRADKSRIVHCTRVYFFCSWPTGGSVLPQYIRFFLPAETRNTDYINRWLVGRFWPKGRGGNKNLSLSHEWCTPVEKQNVR